MEKLIADIDGFLTRASMSHYRFGVLALNDKHLVKQLRNGRRLWPETETRVRDFMASYVSEAA